MAKKSGMLQRQKEMELKIALKYDLEFHEKIDFFTQLFVDCSFMASSDVFQMGPGRCEPFGNAIIGYLNEVANLLHSDAQDDPELVYALTKIDQRLQKICGDKFEPWEVRYEGKICWKVRYAGKDSKAD